MSRFESLALSALLPLLLCLPLADTQAQDLPFDPQMIGEMTPEQRQQALEALGAPSQSQNGTQDQTPAGSSSAPPDVSRMSPEQRRQLLRQLTELQPSQLSSSLPQTAPGQTTSNFAKKDRSRYTDLDRSDDRSFAELKPFGYDLFASSPSTFAPAGDIPVPNDYVVGPGDRLSVQFYGNENKTVTLTVNRDGTIDFPKLGPISVAGRKFDDVSAQIEDRVEHEIIGVSVSITLGTLRSVRVFLLGDVAHPGSYTVSSLATMTNALFFGGGVSEIGSLRKIQLKRDGRLVRTLDLYNLLLHGDSSADERLQPGDVIFVPPVGERVAVGGEVKRPAIYELNGERSLSQLLDLAGGMLASTSTASALVARYDRSHKRSLTQLDIANASSLQFPVMDGDQIQIRRIANELDNSVFVLGEVKYPGRYEWSSSTSMTNVLRLAEIRHSDSNSQVYLPLGLLERTDVQTGARVIQGFNTQAVLTGASPDLQLTPGDRVVLLSRADVDFLNSGPVRKVVAGNFLSTQKASDTVDLKASASDASRFAPDKTAQSSAMSTRSSTATNDTAFAATNEMQRSGTGNGNGNVETGTLEQAQASARQRPATVQNCPGLDSLAKLLNSERGAHYEKAFNYENLRTNRKVELELQDPPCPELMRTMPQALPFLLEASIAIYGEVQYPGLYPAADNTDLDSLVLAAGGVTRETNMEDIEYVSFADALREGHSSYRKTTLVAAKTASLKFSPGDVINFRPLYLGQEIGNVQASGEFRFPGAYGILSGERLSELMQRAGGLSTSAYPYGAIFTRSAAREAERASYRRTAKELQESMVTAITSGAVKADSQATTTSLVEGIVKQLNVAEPLGRVVIEGDPTVLALHPEQDPVLESGDVIYMPKRPISVTVIGQVLNSGSLAFKPGLSASQYIARAGGYTQGADKSRAFIILPNGTAEKMESSFWNMRSHDIPPGSSIVVPRNATPFNASVFTERVIGILSNVAITYAALHSVTN